MTDETDPPNADDEFIPSSVATTDNGTEADSTDRMCYEVQFREPAGYGGKWKNTRRFINCDRVEVAGNVVRFIDDGADKLAVKQDHLINYERRW